MLVPYISEDQKKITVGGFQYGIGRDIEIDNPREMLDFLKFLDGEHDIDSISKHFQMDKSNVIDQLKFLKDLGLIYENNIKNTGLSDIFEIFYTRNLNYFAWIDTEGLYYNYWDVQKKINETKITLLGAGGTGSSCATNLIRMGFNNITIVDFDTVSYDNLNRQNYFFSDVGKKKTGALSAKLKDISPLADIKEIDIKINNIEDVIKVVNLSDPEIIVCCIDKPKKKINGIMMKCVKRTGIPVILGGYASTIITCGYFDRGLYNYQAIFNKSLSENYDAKMINENTFWKWENAAISPVVQIAGSLAALYALYITTGLSKILPGKMLHVDMFNTQTSYFSYIVDNR